MAVKYDFSGWATKNNLKCSDGRIIRDGAFKHQDGQVVPLVWQHMHDSPENVLGYGVLEHRDKGTYVYGVFNNTESGQNAKELVNHGDIVSLSIHANHLVEKGHDVLHGDIKEVSLVMAGANPGAYIEFPTLEHSDDYDEDADEAIIFTGEEIALYHADEEGDDDSDDGDETIQDVLDTFNEKQMKVVSYLIAQALDEKAGAAVKHADEEVDGETVGDVLDTFSDKQMKVVSYLISEALDDAGVEHSDYEGEDEMKHNVFDGETMVTGGVLSHEDFDTIMKDAKRLGSFREALNEHMENGVLSHSIPTEGMVGPSQTTASQTYGFRDPDMLFPDYRSLNNPPEWLKRETGWVDEFLGAVHHTPFSRIKSVFADITEDEARARGYMKGRLKKEEVFTLLKRTTDPQTIYKKQKMDRDDIIDITDFDVIAWIRAEMRIMLNEEIARACLIGDGRNPSSDDKIQEAHVRPIVNDAPLFTIQVEVDPSDLAENFIDAAIRGRKTYKGTGTPTLYTTADMHTEMLLLKDEIGHRLYKTDAELATALRVSKIVEVEVMEGFQLNGADVYGIIVNPADYNIGADKGGEINMFDDFDIDYNQYKYLLETRISGALTKPFSAMVLKKKVTTSGGNTGGNS